MKKLSEIETPTHFTFQSEEIEQDQLKNIKKTQQLETSVQLGKSKNPITIKNEIEKIKEADKVQIQLIGKIVETIQANPTAEILD